ncbi:transposase [Pseudomonas aeruginosa]|uniref:transposase n=1 Tax=Pseudomonas aeruginosa TaxID=287 RepID=UPI00295F59B9|nr:transposase [Pseudomonas aeruginosa]WOT91414.1 transposase [Pseudomonas aeruginosa]
MSNSSIMYKEHNRMAAMTLILYRKRGKAEGHMGELKDTLNVHLSSTCRGASTVQQVMGRNQVSLLLSLYAYQMLHSLRALMERVTQKGWSIRKVREQILKTAATVAVHARKIAVHIGQSGGKWWPSLLKNLPRLHQAQT